MEIELLKRYLQGDVSLDEKVKIHKWLDADEKNMREFIALRKLYDISLWNDQPDLSDSMGNAMNKRHFIYKSLTEIAKIATIFLLAFYTIQYYFSVEPEEEMIMQTLHVPAGQRAELTLTDGTRVWLNAMSAFTFPNKFTNDQRNVQLDGEGFFEINHDPEKPFIVETDKYNVRALGTTFNLISYSNSPLFETSLLEGKIQITLAGGNSGPMMEPNTTVYLEEGLLKSTRIKDYDYFLWTQGLICFDDESISTILDKLQIYYDITIHVLNEDLLNLDYPYTGKFRIKDGIEHVLKVLQVNRRFKYEKNEDDNIITIL